VTIILLLKYKTCVGKLQPLWDQPTLNLR